MEILDEATNTVYERKNTHHQGELLCSVCNAEGRKTQLGNRLYQFTPIIHNIKPTNPDKKLYCSLKCYKNRNN